jgi:uncharacterized protein (TIGR02452 family)
MNNIILTINNIQKFCKERYEIQNNTEKIKFNEKYIINNKLIKNRLYFYKLDTLSCAIKLNQNKPLVLILGDDIVPGGTLISNCQEEKLFRRSTLFSHLTPDYYPFNNDELLYCQNVGVFSENEMTEYNDLKINYYFSFISIAGERNYSGNNENKKTNLENKIRLIFQVAIDKKYDTLILCALGCGAFGCQPKYVSLCFLKVYNEFLYSDLNVVFSILGSSYNIFYDTFSDLL